MKWYYVKIMNEKNCVSFPHLSDFARGLDLIAQSIGRLPWNQNKSTELQMSCLEYIVWYGQFVTNWYNFNRNAVLVRITFIVMPGKIKNSGERGPYSPYKPYNHSLYPMLCADSRFWLVNNREIWSCISRLTSSAWDIKTKERHWWRHNGDSDRHLLSLPLRYDLVTLCLYDDLGQINVIAGILKLWKRFRMSQILFEHGINSLPLVCFRGYGNLSTLSSAIPRLAFGRAWYCDAACG